MRPRVMSESRSRADTCDSLVLAGDVARVADACEDGDFDELDFSCVCLPQSFNLEPCASPGFAGDEISPATSLLAMSVVEGVLAVSCVSVFTGWAS